MVNIDTIPCKKRGNSSRSIFITVVFATLILAAGYVFVNTRLTSKKMQDTETDSVVVQEENSNKLTCSRKSRLENDPNIDRALSLIYQRLTEFGTDDRLFPPQLVNCIKVEVKHTKPETNAEGYFDPNDENIKSDFYPIVVDDWGNFFADDLSTALLLVHEIAHVNQHINRHNYNLEANKPLLVSKSTCLNQEVSAFLTQLIFTTHLKDEEEKSINLRIENDSNLHPQIMTLKNLKKSFSTFEVDDCEKYDTECYKNRIFSHLYQFIDKNGTYNDQCRQYGGI